ncbi:glycoside hydrolase family 3 C-terminal domain-containing protein [Niabella ginsengisoli]|uniref:Glycoside hydrolase family 3 C-terminal domain-containing protein n=1 Tax=Niabella ginsengisoli TaxID=522298 RepID=A0ABS9SMR1_9BACT|nr:glycoside hydrolase family 3 C-terminal domain-containing protein [Niabella ginsengisoli]MCH5599649.1 glycoside hydrolase family 3 C-terminal domain-containing protein [Niabella ginsengisoli]
MLEAKYKLGLFKNPYKYCDESRAKNEIFTDANRKVAKEIAAQSFVLLKNESGLLPLKKSGKIALIGPLADAANNMAGTWSVATKQNKSISVLTGLKQVLGSDAEVLYAKGSNLTADAALEERATMFGKTLNRDQRSEEELAKEALDIAAKADVIIAAMGESAEFSGESSSRTDLNIPETQQKLLKQLLATGKPVVLVLFTGRPLTLAWENENVPAILNVWFGGSEAGAAIADVLFGDVNPSGKLTMSFPQNVGQIPIYYAHKNTGRPLAEGKWFQKFRSNYIDVSNEPLYPFGYGLSYTSFAYGDLKLSDTTLKGNQTLKASIAITNTGKYDGAEVVQLYIRDVVGSVTRPMKELKGFQKVMIKSGESKTVTFNVTAEDLKFYNSNLKYDWEPGEFEIMIGTNAKDVKNGKVNWVK